MGETKNRPANFKESVPARTAQVLLSPILSGSSFMAHKITGGKYRPELSMYFGPMDPNLEISVVFSDLSETLSKIDTKLSKKETFIKEDFAVWKEIQKETEEVTGLKLTDYVLFDETEGRHILFAERDKEIVPIYVPGKNDIQAKEHGFIGVGAGCERIENRSDSVSRELTIFKIEKDEGAVPGTHHLRRLNSVSNEFELRRNSVFERDGEMIEALRHEGAMSVGELQEVTRNLVSYGLSFEDGKLVTDPSLEAILVKTRLVSMGDDGSEEQKLKGVTEEVKAFLEQAAFFKMAEEYFKENPDIVRKFLESPSYLNLRKEFLNTHFGGRGQTEERLAASMLSNYFLALFENTDIKVSPSQKYSSNPEGFMNDIGSFVDQNNVNLPLNLQEMFLNLKNNPLTITEGNSPKAEVLRKADESLTKISNEMWRHRESRKIFNFFVEKSPFDFVDDDSKSSKVFRAIIVNFGLAKVPGEGRFTMASYLPKVPYYPEGSDVLPFDEEEVRYGRIEDSIRYIFNGTSMVEDPTVASKYESQVARIYTEGAAIIRFLSEDKRVPDNVRDFIKTINSEDLGQKILERFGPNWDQDPLVVNRFFAEGFDKFQTMTTHRYVTDFVRGIETNLINLTSGSWAEKTKRKFTANWKNYDFSQVPEDVLQKAIELTLESGKHRLELLNKETTERTTLKDKQEMLEKVFGWDTYDMWFLRWDKFWNVWNTLGGAWDCICFMRKPIFNTGTFKQH